MYRRLIFKGKKLKKHKSTKCPRVLDGKEKFFICQSSLNASNHLYYLILRDGPNLFFFCTKRINCAC